MSGEAHLTLPPGELRSIGDVSLYVVTAGPQDGPPIVLLHGFPEFWFGWRKQIMPLARAGFRVIVPDQRGYGKSDKLEQVADYSLDVLARDVVSLLDTFEIPAARLVGHDWGGLVAWWTAARYPERVSKLIVINAPHPGVIRRFMLRHPLQILQSAYIGLFQIPVLPEAALRARNFYLLERSLTAISEEGTFSARDLAVYKNAWGEPRALTSMLHWYRALRGFPAKLLPVDPPTCILWGRGDPALQADLAGTSLRTCRSGKIRFIDCGHFVQHERPELVIQAAVANESE